MLGRILPPPKRSRPGRRLRFLVSCLLPFAFCLSAAAHPTIRYPKRQPAFTFELPDGWYTDEDPGGTHLLTIRPNGGGVAYRISFVSLPGIDSEHLQTGLRKLVEATIAATKATGITYDEPSDTTLPSGVHVLTQVSTGRLAGRPISCSATVFALPRAGCYAAVLVSSPASADSGQGTMRRIIDSIQPL